MSWGNFAGQLYQAILSTSVTEWVAILTALLYVVLAAIENAWCWPMGIISSGIYVWFNYSIQLYCDTWLSVFYCFAGIYGWYAWLRGNTHRKDGAVLHRASKKILFYCTLAGFAGWILLGFITKKYTRSPVPFFDAAVTSFSFIATWMTARKILENWIFWIVIDAAYIALYFIRHSPATALLFLLYTVIAAYGFYKWKKTLDRSAA